MRWFFGTLLLLALGVGIYIGSALVSLDGLVKAARAGDGAAVLERTDMSRLKDSLVDQIVSAYLKRLGRDRPVKPLERMVANTYGASIADAMLSKMLTEQNLTQLLNRGAINFGQPATINMYRLTEIDTSKVLDVLKRLSLVKPVEFSFHLGDSNDGGAVALHFAGDGWKLSGIQLPIAALQVLADSLIETKGRGG
jgi:hypothetical protein